MPCALRGDWLKEKNKIKGLTFKLHYDIIFIEQKKKEVSCMKKIKWSNVLLLIGFILMIWVGVSFIDVNIHNDIASDSYGQYADWNFFEIFLFERS